MKLIDIDRVKVINEHIHYRKEYEGSALLMDNNAIISRYKIKFSFEHSAIGKPKIFVEFIEQPNYPIIKLIDKLKDKIKQMDSKGELVV